MGGAVAVAGLHLARRWGSELLAVLLVLGATLLAPVVAQGVGVAVSLFLVVLSAAALLARGDRGWPVLAMSRTIPAAGLLLLGVARRRGARVALQGRRSSPLPHSPLWHSSAAVSAGRRTRTDVSVAPPWRPRPSLSSWPSACTATPCARRASPSLQSALAVALAITSRPPIGRSPRPWPRRSGRSRSVGPARRPRLGAGALGRHGHPAHGPGVCRGGSDDPLSRHAVGRCRDTLVASSPTSPTPPRTSSSGRPGPRCGDRPARQRAAGGVAALGAGASTSSVASRPASAG